MKVFYTLLFLVLLCSCGATATYDYDTEKDFTTYSTYNFYPSISSGLSELDENRIFKYTDSILQEKGFLKSQNPQFLVNFYSEEFISKSQNTIGIGIGSSGRNSSVGVSGGIPIGGDEVNQLLTIDIIDTKTDLLIWQAKANGDYKVKANPKQKDNYYAKILAKIFKPFPPNKKN
ncbi:DUF4136 domain-containing protein [uncultured Planktosalinus sp.]|uniref:DUF4136 domain-containing protein n=1 Tax=uncultured Planktosalinus sp. TaxID=1810935 RepID=UPI0030D8CF46